MAVARQSTGVAPDADSIETMTREEGMRLLDRQARKFLGMSGEAFVRQYHEGTIEDPYRLEVARVAMLLPLAELSVLCCQPSRGVTADGRALGAARSAAESAGIPA